MTKSPPQSKPTPEQVQAEIAELKQLVGKVRPFSIFGDDNRASIEAQIDVLSYPFESVEKYASDDYVKVNAQAALDWMAGNLADDEEPPAQSWQGLLT